MLVLGAIGWSAANLWLAGRFSAAGAASPATFAYASAAIYGVGALLTAALGLRATVILATPLLVLVGLVAARTEVLLPPSSYNRLYQALALEQCALLVVVLLIAGCVPSWAAARKEARL
jgi:purine-cytosine permease-like protein